MKNSILFLLFLFTCFFLNSNITNAQNLLNNGGFQSGDSLWSLYLGNGAQANHHIESHDSIPSDSTININVKKIGIKNWDIQLRHLQSWPALKFMNYNMKITIKCSRVDMKLELVNQDTTWKGKTINLSTKFESYVWSFNSGENGYKTRLNFLDTGSYFISNIEITQVIGPPTINYNDTLKKWASINNISIGTAVNPYALFAENEYRHALSNQFNMIVAENVMKMYEIAPTPNTFNFELADSLVNIAIRNNMKIRGHVLYWHTGIPAWMNSITWSDDSLRKWLKNYVYTVVGRYKGKIAEWDVANEYFSDNSGNPTRNTIITTKCGNSIIDSFYIWAHDADSNALLFYNDYSIEYMTNKAYTVYLFMSNMKSRGIPIHGVGFQSHFEFNLTNSFLNSIEQNIERFSAKGFKVAFTEVDIAIPNTIDPEDYNTQGRDYANLIRIALKYPETIQTFTLWGFTDKYSWIPSFWQTLGQVKDDALIFDRNYLTKPAYDSIINTLKSNQLNTKVFNNTYTTVIYPNPTMNYITINTNKPAQLSVFNISGTSIYKSEKSETYHLIDLSTQPSGIYFINDGVKSYKVMKLE